MYFFGSCNTNGGADPNADLNAGGVVEETADAGSEALAESETENSDGDHEDKIIYPDTGIKENLPDSKPSVGEDLFLYFNYDELKNMELPDGYSSYTTMALMAANVVNACYRFSDKDINIPAAILKDPIFSSDNSVASNYGGLGSLAGHELTHGFDSDGSQYDKDGNLQNWWTDEDKEAFTALAQKVADRYARYALVDNESSSPDLIIGEAVADLGGAATALDVLAELKKGGEEINYEDFFRANTVLWCRLLTRENSLKRIKTDPHPANCLRVNINLTQFEEFYDTFDVKEGDNMYTAPEDRLSVW